MSYIVDRIPGSIRIDPDAGGQERQRKRERQAHKAGQADSVSISDEAKRRSSLEEESEPKDTVGS